MVDRKDEPNTIDEQVSELAEELAKSVAEGVLRGLAESGWMEKMAADIQALQTRVKELETKPAPAVAPKVKPAAVKPPPQSATMPSIPMSMVLDTLAAKTGPVVKRPRKRTVSRPTVTYRSDPRSSAGFGGQISSTCSEPGCDLPVRSRGLCSAHYQRQRYQEQKIADKQSKSDPLPPPPPSDRRQTTKKSSGGTQGIFAILYEEKGKKNIAGLINQMKFDRCDVMRRLNEQYQGTPGIPLNEEDVLRVVHYHKLGDILYQREAEIVCRHLSKQRGSLAKTAQKMKWDIEKLNKRITQLNLEITTTKIRNDFKDEILSQTNFGQRLDLALTKEKYLEDLGIEQEIDASLKADLDQQMDQLGPPAMDEEGAALRAALALDEERFRRLVKRFGLAISLPDGGTE